MSYVHSQTGSGLILAEQSTDVAAVERALRRHDPCLELQGWPTVWQGDFTVLYKVVARPAKDAPPSTVYVHQLPDGTPLPLSSRIVEEVQRHDRNTRGRVPDVDELTRQKKRADRKDYEDFANEAVAEFGPKLDGKKSSPLPRSRSLYLARNKQRAREKNPEFRP